MLAATGRFGGSAVGGRTGKRKMKQEAAGDRQPGEQGSPTWAANSADLAGQSLSLAETGVQEV